MHIYKNICTVGFLSLTRLQVVSTRVGGVPEVLPQHLIRLAEPSAKGKGGTCMIGPKLMLYVYTCSWSWSDAAFMYMYSYSWGDGVFMYAGIPCPGVMHI